MCVVITDMSAKPHALIMAIHSREEQFGALAFGDPGT